MYLPSGGLALQMPATPRILWIQEPSTTVQRPSAGTEIRRMFSPGCERFNMRQERGGLQFTKAEY
jgi:hypothetical protein